jgi:hypothetical protein
MIKWAFSNPEKVAAIGFGLAAFGLAAFFLDNYKREKLATNKEVGAEDARLEQRVSPSSQ